MMPAEQEPRRQPILPAAWRADMLAEADSWERSGRRDVARRLRDRAGRIGGGE